MIEDMVIIISHDPEKRCTEPEEEKNEVSDVNEVYQKLIDADHLRNPFDSCDRVEAIQKYGLDLLEIFQTKSRAHLDELISTKKVVTEQDVSKLWVHIDALRGAQTKTALLDRGSYEIFKLISQLNLPQCEVAESINHLLFFIVINDFLCLDTTKPEERLNELENKLGEKFLVELLNPDTLSENHIDRVLNFITSENIAQSVVLIHRLSYLFEPTFNFIYVEVSKEKILELREEGYVIVQKIIEERLKKMHNWIF